MAKPDMVRVVHTGDSNMNVREIPRAEWEAQEKAREDAFKAEQAKFVSEITWRSGNIIEHGDSVIVVAEDEYYSSHFSCDKFERICSDYLAHRGVL